MFGFGFDELIVGLLAFIEFTLIITTHTHRNVANSNTCNMLTLVEFINSLQKKKIYIYLLYLKDINDIKESFEMDR